MIKFIALYRVSTTKQQVSGLGLEAQQQAVSNYVLRVGGSIIAHFQETESGGNKDRISVDMDTDINKLLRKRPILKQVLELAQKEGATIVVKEISRLTRYPFLMEYIIQSKIKFVAADNPNDDVLLLRIKTALHAEELIKVSTRTKAAWDAKKQRGYVHIVPNNLTEEANAKSLETRIANARSNENSRRAMGYIKMLRDHNNLSYRDIVKRLNSEGFKTPRGKNFDPTQVKRLYDKA